MSVCGDRLAGGQTAPQYDGEYKAKGWEERESEESRGGGGPGGEWQVGDRYGGWLGGIKLWRRHNIKMEMYDIPVIKAREAPGIPARR